MTNWEATPERCFTRHCVVERHGDRTTRVIADDLSREEAALIANSQAVRDALGLFIDAAMNGEMPSVVVRAAATEVFIASQGLERVA